MMLVLREKLRWFSELIGSAIAWLTVLMAVGTFVIVVLRYAFDAGWIWMQESIVWMHAAVFMLGAAYTLNRDEHVRVDIFYRSMSERGKAWIDLFGILLFLLPMAIFLGASSWAYVATSWAIQEASREAGGLPYPFVSVLKSLIPLTAVLLVLQGLADLVGRVLVITGRRSSGEVAASGGGPEAL